MERQLCFGGLVIGEELEEEEEGGRRRRLASVGDAGGEVLRAVYILMTAVSEMSISVFNTGIDSIK